MKRHAFTLIELLVVVAIIVALLAILMPSMGKAMVAAELAQCASNTRQIATAAIAYASDNFGIMMSTQKTTWYAAGREPVCIGTDPANTSGDWNLHRIQPYVNGFDLTTRRAQGVFICPSVNQDFYQWFGQKHWDLQWPSGRRFTQVSYGYFAGVDRWVASERRGGAERMLCESRPGGSDRLLVSDALMPDSNGEFFRYNHGTRGWGFSWQPIESATNYGKSTGAVYEYAPPSITGLNQAFGDGSVRWKDDSQIKTHQMLNAASYSDPWVDRGGGAPAYF